MLNKNTVTLERNQHFYEKEPVVSDTLCLAFNFFAPKIQGFSRTSNDLKPFFLPMD